MKTRNTARVRRGLERVLNAAEAWAVEVENDQEMSKAQSMSKKDWRDFHVAMKWLREQSVHTSPTGHSESRDEGNP